MREKIKLIANKIKKGGKNVVFTGAGISTESGIPDYRSQGGIWDRFRPVYFDEFMSSRDAREEYWRRWKELYAGITRAEPNAGHIAIAKLDRMGLLDAVITQNVDGLHQASGLRNEKIIDLHGNTRRIRKCPAAAEFRRCRSAMPVRGLSEARYDFIRPGHARQRGGKSRRTFPDQ